MAAALEAERIAEEDRLAEEARVAEEERMAMEAAAGEAVSRATQETRILAVVPLQQWAASQKSCLIQQYLNFN